MLRPSAKTSTPVTLETRRPSTAPATENSGMVARSTTRPGRGSVMERRRSLAGLVAQGAAGCPAAAGNAGTATVAAPIAAASKQCAKRPFSNFPAMPRMMLPEGE